MSREDPQLRIRLPVELKEIIESFSKENKRSMNAEIVTLLELAIRVCRDFGPEDGPVVQQFRERLDALNSKNEQEQLIPKLLEIIERQKMQVDKLIGMVERSAPLSEEYKEKYLGDENKKPT